MNNLLQKCLMELQKDQPRLEYITGVLETLIEMQPAIAPIATPSVSNNIPVVLPIPKDEGTMLDSIAAARIAKLKADSERMQNE
jgi:hypothetical protein